MQIHIFSPYFRKFSLIIQRFRCNFALVKMLWYNNCMNNTHLEQLKKWRWLICLPFVLLFAYLFSPHTFSVFLLTVAVLYIIALLFLYGRASWLLFFGLSLLPMVTTSLILNFHKKFNLLDILVFMALFSISLVFSYLLARKKAAHSSTKTEKFPTRKNFNWAFNPICFFSFQ